MGRKAKKRRLRPEFRGKGYHYNCVHLSVDRADQLRDIAEYFEMFTFHELLDVIIESVHNEIMSSVLMEAEK